MMKDSVADDTFFEGLVAAIPRLKARKSLSPSVKAFVNRVNKIMLVKK